MNEDAKSRTYYAKRFKRQTLVDLTRGSNVDDIFLNLDFDIYELMMHDKKYIAKLLHKWKRGLEDSLKDLYLVNRYQNNNDILNDIEMLGKDDEPDLFTLYLVRLHELKMQNKRNK